MSEAPASQDPELLRRLLRAKDRMDAASHEDWPVRAAGAREPRLRGALRAIVQAGLRRAAASLPADAAHRAGDGAAARHRPADHRDRLRDRLGEPGHLRPHLPRRHRREPERGAGARARPPRTSSAACPPASSAPRTGPTSRSQFRRSGGASADGTNEASNHRRSDDESRCPRGRSVRARSGRGARLLRRQARLSRPHRRAQRRLSLADGAASGPAVVPARPVHARAAGARRGDRADAARDRRQGRDAAAGAGRRRLPRRLRAHARARRRVHPGAGRAATATSTPAFATRRATAGR